MSAIERRPTHLNECLWRHYFRTRNIVTLLSPVYLSCLSVVATRHEPSPLLATRGGSGVLDRYEKKDSLYLDIYMLQVNLFLRSICDQPTGKTDAIA